MFMVPLCGMLAPASSGAADGGGTPPSTPRGASSATVNSSAALLTAAGRGVVVPPGIADVEHMCAMILGCRNIPLQVPTRDLGVCVRYFSDQLSGVGALVSSLTIRECGVGAVSCGQFSRCALRGAEPNACDGRGMDGNPVGRCDIGGRALQCVNGKVAAVRDCPRGGELCAVRHGEAECVAGRCTMEDGKPSKPVCSSDGTRMTYCKNGRTVSLSCSALGLQCAVVGGEPKCVPSQAKTCSGASSRCDRAAAVECVDGHEVRVECDKANLVCGIGTEGASRMGSCAWSPYSGRDDECDPKTYQSRCAGNDVQYCVGGRLRKYGCKTYFGLNRCAGRLGEAHCE